MMRTGWFKESHRHSLAAKGIKTNKYMARRTPANVLYPYGRSPGDLPQRLDAERLRRLRDNPETRAKWDEYRALEVKERELRERIEDVKDRVIPTYGVEDKPVMVGEGEFSPATVTPYADEALQDAQKQLAKVLAKKKELLYGEQESLIKADLLAGISKRGPPRDVISERFERKAKETLKESPSYFESSRDSTTEAAKKSELAGRRELKELGFKIPEQPKQLVTREDKGPVDVSEEDISEIASAMKQTGFTQQQIDDQVAALRQGKTLFGRRTNLAEKQPAYRDWM